MTAGARPTVAYFSMEVALERDVPTYSGGLGVLAGDTIRSSADLGLPMVAVTLLHRRGYFRQSLDREGRQSEQPVKWDVGAFLEPTGAIVSLELAGRPVCVRAWRYPVGGQGGSMVPVYLLDTDLPENAPEDRRLTDLLYGGDHRYRLCQEVVLGIGGVRMLRALGHRNVDRFHLNEGHAALAVLALLEERLSHESGPEDVRAAIDAVRTQCVFTTHTPVPAGHDRFPAELYRPILGASRSDRLAALGQGDILNLTDLALRASHFVNGVAMRHGEVSRDMFAGYPIRSITNGIHPPTWAAPSFGKLFDDHVPDWRRDALTLRYAIGIPLSEVGAAHREAKRALLARVREATSTALSEDAFTIGFARRATAYKRATLVFRNLERLAGMAKAVGPIQLVFAGKAHPADGEGKQLIRRIHEARRELDGRVSVVYLPEYDMDVGRLMCSGADVWLNTPAPPLEASGTSGMKAALNGVPSFSVLDGWWLEGHVEDITGWAIGPDAGLDSSAGNLDAEHAEALYEKLETSVLPCYYGDPERYLGIRRSAIALNASFFNTQRMVLQYLYDAYLEPGGERG